MSVSYRIAPAEFGWLSQAFPQKNVISPFAAFAEQSASFNEKSKASLISQRVISEDGTIEPSALAAFEVLARADAYSRMRVLGVDAPVDKVTYFRGKSACSVDSVTDGFAVAFPAMSKEAGFVVEEFTGSSRMVNVPFHTSLSPNAALAFLAVVDLYRTHTLLALAGEPRDVRLGASQVLERANGSGSFMAFTTSLKNLVSYSKLSSDDVAVALGELAERGLIEEKGGSHHLLGDALELATTFVLPQYVFNISSGLMLSADTAEHSECYVIFCGMHDLLYLDTDQGMITIETMSGSDLLGILVSSLTEPPAKRK